MQILTAMLLAAGVLGAIYGALVAVLYRREREARIVICPETGEAVAVTIDAAHAALTAASGDMELRIEACARWPERCDCDRACVAQIERAPEECLLRATLVRWHAGKACALCGRPFAEQRAWEERTALLTPEGTTRAWDEVPRETIGGVLASHQPVCWKCHVADSLRRTPARHAPPDERLEPLTAERG